MRYIGSKAKILHFIEDSVHSWVRDKKGLVFADLFAGTTIVAQHFKRLGYSILSNDYMTFSYILQVALVENSASPTFENLKIGGYPDVLEHLNSLKPIEGFFFKNYSKTGSHVGDFERNYFSDTNASKIDAVLNELRGWMQKGLLSRVEDAVLRASLIHAVTKVSNISGTYGCFLKDDDPRKFKELQLEPLRFIPSGQIHKVFNEDALSLIDKICGDILYVDPPYNQRQYPPYYHILETVSLDDNPKIYGKTGRRPYKDKLSPFCIKGKVKEAMRSLVSRARFDHIFLSYNTEGLMSVNEIEGVLSEVGKPQVSFCGYRRYKSNNGGVGQNEVKEALFYVCKDGRKAKKEKFESKKERIYLF